MPIHVWGVEIVPQLQRILEHEGDESSPTGWGNDEECTTEIKPADTCNLRRISAMHTWKLWEAMKTGLLSVFDVEMVDLRKEPEPVGERIDNGMK